MEILNKESAAELVKRFWDFHDSLIHKITIARDEKGERSVTIDLETQDFKDDDNGKWVNVQFKLHGLGGHRLQNITFVVFELRISFFDEVVCLDFAAGGTEPPQSAEDVRKSEFFFVGHQCEWGILSEC